MKTRHWAIFACIALLVAVIATVVVASSRTNAGFTGLPLSETADNGGVPSRVPDDGVVLYYFHLNVRCTTCRDMEQYARELVADRFGSHVVAGRLHWMPVNVQQPANRHFVSDFKALTRSLVLERRQGGRTLRYKVLHEAWLHLIDRSELDQYLSSEIDEFLAEPGESSGTRKVLQEDDASVRNQAEGELR